MNYNNMLEMVYFAPHNRRMQNKKEGTILNVNVFPVAGILDTHSA